MFLYNNRIVGSVLLREYTGKQRNQRKLVLCIILYTSVIYSGSACKCVRLCTNSTYQWLKYKTKNTLILKLNKNYPKKEHAQSYKILPMYDLEHILSVCLITGIWWQIYNNYPSDQYLKKTNYAAKVTKLHYIFIGQARF